VAIARFIVDEGQRLEVIENGHAVLVFSAAVVAHVEIVEAIAKSNTAARVHRDEHEPFLDDVLPHHVHRVIPLAWMTVQLYDDGILASRIEILGLVGLVEQRWNRQIVRARICQVFGRTQIGGADFAHRIGDLLWCAALRRDQPDV
jgi:hypothetical protein